MKRQSDTIDIGRKFAMSPQEAAEIARLPFVRRSRRSPGRPPAPGLRP